MATSAHRVTELMQRWEQLRQRGQPVSPEQLCADCPELLPEVKELLRTRGADQPTLPPDSCATQPPTQSLPVDDRLGFLAPPQAPDEVGRLGLYRVLRVLGAGGMGMVLHAEDPQLQRPVALKVMLPSLAASPESRQRFLREARAAAALKHDHVVTIYEVSEDRGVPFLAMEFLEGKSLEQWLDDGGKPSLSQALRIAREIAAGLAAAHKRGLIHRDIKPANVWLDRAEKGRVKLLDFGLARAVKQDAQLTRSGTIVGTPAYMAPEQAKGEAVDGRCDLFSLGCVLYRLCTGQAPFKGTDLMSVLLAVALEEPQPVRELNPQMPAGVAELVGRLLAKDREKRPASTEDVVRELQALEREARLANSRVNQTQTQPVAKAVAATPVRKARRSRAPLMVALALLALVPLGWWLAAVVLRVETPDGTLVVEMDDAETEARVKGGKLVLTGPDDKVRYTLSAGKGDSKIEAGPYKVRVEGADGLALDTPEFTMKKGGKVTVRVTAEPKGVTKASDPDRKAAEYVLSIGGVIVVNVKGQDREIREAADLPRDAFRLTDANLGSNKRVSNAGLAVFKDCKHLTGLSLYGCSQVNDTGLAYFRGCKKLRGLYLACVQASDNGLTVFKDCKDLTSLDLQCNTQVSDAGLAVFKGCKSLTYLVLHECWRVSDTGLAHFKDCKNLTLLNLHNTQVSSASLAHFKDCDKLALLYLPRNADDACLAYFKDCKKLTDLGLDQTQVSDKGVAQLKDWTNLTSVSLNNTQVSDLSPLQGMKLRHLSCKGTRVADLSPLKGMPLKELHCDFKPERDADILRSIKTLETINGKPALEFWREVNDKAARDPDRRAAEYVLSIGGAVRINGQDRDIRNTAELPKDPFQLTSADLYDNKKVNDEGLARFGGCKNLTNLNLWSCGEVSDAGLAHFKDCKNLTALVLDSTKVSDAGLAYFKDCKSLKTLSVQCTQVTGVGLAHFEDCQELATLVLYHCDQLGDSGLSRVRGWKNLTCLNLAHTQLSDAGMACFKGCKKLTLLYLPRNATDASLASLKDCEQLTELGLVFTRVSDKGFGQLKECKNLAKLWLHNTQVSDLSPLRGLQLTHIACDSTRVTDLSPLKGMPLKEISCDFEPERDTEILKSFKTLETINGKPALEFWREVNDKAAGDPDRRAGERLTLKGHRSWVYSVAFSPDGKRLASASADGTVKVWDADKGGVVTFNGHTGRVHSVAYSPDGKRLASASGHPEGNVWRGEVKVWDAEKGTELLSFKGHTRSVLSVVFSPDGKRLASASEDKTVKVWDAEKGSEALSFKGNISQFNSVAFSPDGKRLASESQDKMVKVWDTEKGQEALTIESGCAPVAFSADGKRLASSSQDKTVKIWDAEKGTEILSLKGHTDRVTGVAFSADGKRLASASWDKTVKVWDADKGTEVLSLKGHAGPVFGLTFSPDGKRLASASADGTVKVWDLP